MKKATAKTPDSATKTSALLNFEANLEQITIFLSRLGIGQVENALNKTTKILAEESKAAPAVNFKKIKRRLDLLGAAVGHYEAFRKPAYRMMSVMLVSFLEAYLEDGLIDISCKNPRVIKNPVIDPSRLLEIDTIDQLRTEIRLNWAQGALRPGGPATWEKLLRALGAPEIQPTTLRAIQHLWDTRNLIVHSRSTATNAYAKTYESSGYVAGSEVKISPKLFEKWVEETKAFIDRTEPFFLKYGNK
jgi:hypothetical protein